MRVVLLGPLTYNQRPLEDLVHEYGLDHLVLVMSPTTHQVALSYLKGADVAVLFGQSGNAALASVPAKVYEYIGLVKPVLAIGAGQEVRSIMRRGGCQLWWVNDGDIKKCASLLGQIVEAYDRGSLCVPSDAQARLTFTAQSMAEKLEQVLQSTITGADRGIFR